MLKPESLNAWCDNIRAAGFELEAGYGIEDTYLLGIGRNDKADKLFLNKEEAAETFRNLMPELLKIQADEEGYKLNVGAITFHPAENSEETSITGYAVSLKL